ncbi:MAG: hypothetical protein AAF443_08040, partial [Chlamydiota bacterium]
MSNIATSSACHNRFYTKTLNCFSNFKEKLSPDLIKCICTVAFPFILMLAKKIIGSTCISSITSKISIQKQSKNNDASAQKSNTAQNKSATLTSSTENALLNKLSNDDKTLSNKEIETIIELIISNNDLKNKKQDQLLIKVTSQKNLSINHVLSIFSSNFFEERLKKYNYVSDLLLYSLSGDDRKKIIKSIIENEEFIKNNFDSFFNKLIKLFYNKLFGFFFC